MVADVGPRGRAYPGVADQHVVDAQCRIVPAENLEHVVVDPRRSAELKRPAHRTGSKGEELLETTSVATPSRWELHEGRAKRDAEALDAFDVVRQPRCGVQELLSMASELSELDGVDEPGRCPRSPLAGGFGRRKSVEGAVELDCREEGYVVLEPASPWDIVGVDDSAPVVVGPARATDPRTAASFRHLRLPAFWSPRRPNVVGVRFESTLSTAAISIDFDCL